MHIHECLPSGSTFHVCATLQAASRACPASAHSSSPSMPTGQAPVLEPHALNSPWLLPLTHTCWYSGLRLVMLRSVWCLFGAPGACSSNDRQRLPSRGYLISRATNPSEWFETSPACSSALPATGRRGGHPAAGTASPAALAVGRAYCPPSSRKHPRWEKLLEKQTSVTQTDLGDRSSTPNTSQQLLWQALVLWWEKRTAELSTAKGEN